MCIRDRGERELFFDLAAKERNGIPADVTKYILEHEEIIEVVRALNNSPVELEYLKKIKQIAEEAGKNAR